MSAHIIERMGIAIARHCVETTDQRLSHLDSRRQQIPWVRSVIGCEKKYCRATTSNTDTWTLC
jgi:hypothetical protein